MGQRWARWMAVAVSQVVLLMLVGVRAAVAAPTVQWLVATPSTIATGGSTTLRWQVDGADSVAIDNGIGAVPASGTLQITPGSTRNYTLTALGGGDTVTAQHTVVVGAHTNTAGGRFVRMMAPLGGQRFTAPASLRVFAAAYDPNTFGGCGASGQAHGCAVRVDFYVDDTVQAQVTGTQAEYWVYKSAISAVAAGTHRVWARATYANPAATLDSESMWITVDPAPAYAQTIDLTQDMVLTGANHFELNGTAGGRIRLNGHGFRIRSQGTYTGRLTLRHVDLFDLGTLNNATPAIDVATNNTVVIEQSVFDTTNGLALSLSGSAAATVRGNHFRSNMRMPAAQQPEFEPDASYPAFRASGSSTGTKLFQGNAIGLGWADFRNADRWLIGGDTDAEANVVMGPRAGIWAQNLSRSTLRGNLVYHVYFGGWSQGNTMEVGNSSDLVIEHNVIGGGSWPIRGLNGMLRYNLVLDAGHQWLWVTDDNAQVHHNIFAGGEGDVAGIWLIYGPQNVRLYNNTLDGLSQSSLVKPVWVGTDGATAMLRSNAIVNARNPPGVAIDGTLDADYNLFSGQTANPRNYSDNRRPAHDVGILNAQTDPRFSAPSEPLRYRLDDWQSRRITARQVLAHYRLRYTPAVGSPLIDAGDPGSAGVDTLLRTSFEDGEVPGVAGNDIGAVGAGAPAADDLFGRQLQP